MRRAIAFCVLALTIAAAVPPAQLRPDFSGEWRPLGGDTTPQQLGAGSPPPPPRTLLVTIAQTSEGLEIGRRVEADGREVVYHFTFRLDGKENVNQMGPLVCYTRASWEGSSEVAVENRRIGTLRETYAVEDGKLMIDTIRTGPAGTMKDRTAHERVVRTPIPVR
jgi:hypothetical protein